MFLLSCSRVLSPAPPNSSPHIPKWPRRFHHRHIKYPPYPYPAMEPHLQQCKKRGSQTESASARFWADPTAEPDSRVKRSESAGGSKRGGSKGKALSLSSRLTTDRALRIFRLWWTLRFQISPSWLRRGLA